MNAARLRGFGSAGHLAVRFFGSLVPLNPSVASERWALGQLLPDEQLLFKAMSAADRRHAIGVARRALAILDRDDTDPAPGRDFVAAALLHDVGKTKARLGTFGRVAATLVALALGQARVLRWAPPGGRLVTYLSHDRVGADLLDAAGSSPLTVAWTREHHLPEERWSLDRQLASALKQADGD